ncbi:MAG: PorT family protein, partial [Bacteroidia bacterium]|nr:PorT family protein [Bacteroidia bacterium]
FHVKYTNQIKAYDSLMAVVAKPSGGFNIGIVTNLRLGTFFDLRFIPQLTFSERNILFYIRDQQNEYYEVRKSVESTFIDFPIDLKYKSERLNNGRAYLVMGGKYSLDLATNKRAKDSGDKVNIKLLRNSFSAQFGFGLDFYTTYFKFSPEVKFGIGLNNVLIKDGGPYSSSIDKLFNKMWLIGFTFE